MIQNQKSPESFTQWFRIDFILPSWEKTAAEIIYHQADSSKKNMGLTTWKYTPDGRILKSDTAVAKNYLQEKEIKRLERTISGYFDYIENLIERQNTFTMNQLADSVDKFLNFNEFRY
jgi:hypothetical protein